jgi:hypothetical protein
VQLKKNNKNKKLFVLKKPCSIPICSGKDPPFSPISFSYVAGSDVSIYEFVYQKKKKTVQNKWLLFLIKKLQKYLFIFF